MVVAQNMHHRSCNRLLGRSLPTSICRYSPASRALRRSLHGCLERQGPLYLSITGIVTLHIVSVATLIQLILPSHKYLLFGGSWDLVAAHNSAYNPTYGLPNWPYIA